MDKNNENTKNELDQNQDFEDETEEHAENNEIKTLNGENTTEKENIIVDSEIQKGENINDLNLIEIEETEKIEQEHIELQLIDLNRNLIEGAFYAAGRPLNIEELSTKLEIPKKQVEELVNALAYDYLERSSALIIAQVGDKYQMQLRPEYTERVSKFAKGGAIAERYLRTLTIIALKQPILKSTVIKLRGTGAYEHVKYLLDNDLISAVKKGRTHELTTTDKYADMFGLPKNKEDLKRLMVTQLGLHEENQ